MSPEEVSIPIIEYLRLKEDQEFLDALRAAGVDNWEGYEHAMEIYNEEN